MGGETMNRPALASVIVAALVVGALAWYPLPAGALEIFGGHGLECDPSGPLTDLHQYDGGPLDLDGCQQYCRSIYGVDPYWWSNRGWDRARGVGYGVCIQDCNTRYWKAWDRDMKDLGKQGSVTE
jgi:hypothetical protein